MPTGYVLARLANRHFSDGFHDPLEVVLADPLRFAIRRRITKVDCHRHAIANGEFYGVKVVTKILIQSQNALLDLLQNFLRRIPLCSVTQMERVPWLVGHDPDLTLINGIAAEIH